MKKIFNGHENEGGIYRITNVKNGKFYIGSAKNFLRRAREHEKCLRNNKHQNKHLQASWNKWGAEAFLFEVVEVVEGTITKIREVEQKYLDNLIKEKKWKKTFNISKKTIQNEPSCFSKNPEETRRKKSEATKKLHSDPVFKEKYKAALKRNAKTYQFISPEGIVTTITNLKEFCKNHPELHHSGMLAVWNEKLRSHKGWFKHNPKTDWRKRTKTVYQFDLNGNLLRRWNSVSEAASAVGLKSHTNISDCANGKTQTACNFIWKFDDKPIDLSNIKKKYEKLRKPVYQYSIDGKVLIKKWSSAKEAAEKIGCAGSNISLCANGKLRTCGGFVWKFDDRRFDDRRIVQKKLKIKKKRATPKKVYQFDLQGNLIKEWSSASEAARELGCHRSAISACAKGQTQTSGNFVWKFDDKQIDLEKLKIKKKGRPPKKVYQFDLQNNLIKEWRSASEAARELGCDSSAISQCARGTYRTAAGYVWSYEPTPPKQSS